MKYLAFDLEIAFDFSHISTDLFPPDDGEQVLLDKEIINEDGEKEAIWVEAKYIGNIIRRFQLPDGELINSAHWKYQGGDWKRFRPLGITCAAAASDGDLWNWRAQGADGRFGPKMARIETKKIVEILTSLTLGAGYTLLTWNGLGFDFPILAEESGMYDECKELALNHVDMMFHFFCSKGFPLGLDAAAKGMNLPGKPEGMTGARAPELWANGEYHRVLDYVSLDVKNTLDLAQAVDDAYCLEWTAQSRRRNTWYSERWLTVKEAMTLPEPDTSWMDSPWPRSKFYEWTGHEPVLHSKAIGDLFSQYKQENPTGKQF